VAALALVGADPALTELRDPLVAPGYERATVRTVYRLLASMPGWDWMQWNGISAALAEALALEAAPRWCETLDDYVVDLPSTWPEYLATLSRKMRKNLRHEPLRRDGYDFELVVAREVGEVHAALSRFLELHTLRANMTTGTPHPDRFTTRPLRVFLHGVCERLAMRDAVRLFQLRIADQIIASRIGFVLGDGLYLYYSGFEPAWAQHAVMTTMMAEVMRYAIASGLRSVNLSLLAEHSKIRWRPRRVDFYSALVHRDSLRSRLACRAYHMTMSGQGIPGRLLKHLLQPSRRDWN
jgi:CelD/BcsL family acetyltransferase involved in cellulose biosynthesis